MEIALIYLFGVVSAHEIRSLMGVNHWELESGTPLGPSHIAHPSDSLALLYVLFHATRTTLLHDSHNHRNFSLGTVLGGPGVLHKFCSWQNMNRSGIIHQSIERGVLNRLHHGWEPGAVQVPGLGSPGSEFSMQGCGSFSPHFLRASRMPG